MSLGHIVERSFHFLGCFVLYLSATLLIGGLVGAFLFLTIGALTHPEAPVLDRLSRGFYDGVLYAGVWAIGLSIVLCVMRGHREHLAAKAQATEEAS